MPNITFPCPFCGKKMAVGENLVGKKLEKTANQLRKEGWKWVEVRASFDHDEWSECEPRYPDPVPLSGEEEAELGRLHEEYETLWNIEEPDDGQQTPRCGHRAHRRIGGSPDRMVTRNACYCRSRGHARP